MTGAEEKNAPAGQGKVLFLGNRSDVDRLYQAMDVLVFPSRYEGLGMVTIEAQMCGVRTIASTAVPEEVRLTDKILFLRLSEGAKVWAEYVNRARRADRVWHDGGLNSRMETMEKGKETYDIQTQAEKMGRYYREKYRDVLNQMLF